MHSDNTRRGAASKAFTLVELLMVMTIVILLLGMAVTGMTALASNRMDGAVRIVYGYMENARQHAVANGTYVYVGLAQRNPTKDSSQAVLIVLASNDGTDVLNGSGGNLQLPEAIEEDVVAPLGEVVYLENFKFLFTDDEYGVLIETPLAGMEVPQGAAAFRMETKDGEIVFDRVFSFRPSGDVALGSSRLPTTLEFGLELTPAGKKDPAKFLLAGLTGIPRVYRVDLK